MIGEVGSRSEDQDRAAELVEVLDRVLDRGIVIDAEVRLDVAGLALAGIEVHIVVACIETYLEYADALGCSAPASWWSASDREGRRRSGSLGEESGGAHRIRRFLDDGGGPI